ncbi:MAG: hypothetical protein K0U41_06740 [Gammaproteobacteria bacterium]|nr:hypothetical protein [Gammaproteobacteria bacterium]
MTNFNDVKMDVQVEHQEEKVYTPQGGVAESGIYQAKILDAHLQVSSTSKAKGLKLNLRLENGSFVEETLWVIGKQGTPYYTKEGKNFELPGYMVANSLANLVVGKDIDTLTTEEKIIADRSFGAAEGATRTVSAFVELIGQDTKVGIRKEVEFKKALVNGQFIDTNETKELNHIDRFFCPSSGQTAKEKRNNLPAQYSVDFLETSKGKVFDRTKGKKPEANATTTQTTVSGLTPAF